MGCEYGRENAPLQPEAALASGPNKEINKCPAQHPVQEHQSSHVCGLMNILDQAILIHLENMIEKKEGGCKEPLDCLLMCMAASHLSNTASLTHHTLLILSVLAQTNCSCLPCFSLAENTALGCRFILLPSPYLFIRTWLDYKI